jgi:hypothetical protein
MRVYFPDGSYSENGGYRQPPERETMVTKKKVKKKVIKSKVEVKTYNVKTIEVGEWKIEINGWDEQQDTYTENQVKVFAPCGDNRFFDLDELKEIAKALVDNL